MFRTITRLLLAAALFWGPAQVALAGPGGRGRAAPAPGAAGVVGDGTPASCTQAALHTALAGGGLVTFNCGGPKTIIFATPETISLDTVVDGGTFGSITLSGNMATRLFEVSAGASLTLRHLILRDAASTGSDGGAISSHGALTVENSTIQDSTTDTAHSGGAIFSDGPVTITNSSLRDNTGGSAGALFANFANARVVISDADFYGNQAVNAITGYGGAIWIGAQAHLTLSFADVSANQARTGGALYLSPGAVVTLTNTGGDVLFSGNTAAQNGGAIYNEAGTLRLTGVVLEANSVPTGTVGAGGGGAIYSTGPLMLQDSVLQQNHARFGGGLYAQEVTTLIDTQFLDNTTRSDGGGALIFGDPTLIGGRFQGNACTNTGGCAGAGLYVEGSPTLTNTMFLSNTSQSAGGGLSAVGTVRMTGGRFQGNQCLRTGCIGGGLFSEGNLVLTDTLFVGNLSQAGGGGTAGNAITLTGGRLENNLCSAADCLGGGVQAGGALTLVDTDVISNSSQLNGGGAAADGSTRVQGGVFRDNQCAQASCLGGGLYAGKALTLIETAFMSNTSGFDGGGVFAASALTLTNGLFQNNQCTAADCTGGGLSTGATLALTGTRFIANSATGHGGALGYGGAGGTVANALFARNTAGGSGAALYLAGVGSLGVVHSTIAGPAPNGTAAVFVANGTVGITNTIIASHTVGISQTTTPVSEDYNLFFDVDSQTAGGVTSGGHSLTGNPSFANAAGDDYHLGMGSAAIDAGVDAGITTDADGDPRPLFAGFDIGYDEFALRLLFLPLIKR